MNDHLALSTTVTLTPLRAGLCSGRDNVVELLVHIDAPDAPAGHTAQRAPQAIALVIDRSGSMAGRPVAEARRCAEYVVSKLRPTDCVSLVQFDNRVERLCSAVPLGDGALLRAAIAGIHAGGNTHLHGGWLEGAQTLADVAGSGLKRVILLSDGQANEGLTELPAISEQCGQWAARGVTTSTYGLGNSFNEELMVAMARAGGGNHYYGDTAEDLMDPFQQELELLGNLCMRDLRMSARVPDGVEVQMVNDLPAVGGGWRLPDLAWGAQAWAVLRLNVPTMTLRLAGERMEVMRVLVSAYSPDGESVQLERAGLSLAVMTPAAFDALPANQFAQRRLTELAAAEAMTRMRDAAARGEWDTVDHLLEEACRQFAGNEWLAAMLEAMKAIADARSRERLLKESMYSSGKLRFRLAAKDEDVRFCLDTESTGPSYLRRKPAQGRGEPHGKA